MLGDLYSYRDGHKSIYYYCGCGHEFNGGLCEKQVVIDAWVESEKTIGDVTYQQTGGQIRKIKGSGPSTSEQQGSST